MGPLVGPIKENAPPRRVRATRRRNSGRLRLIDVDLSIDNASLLGVAVPRGRIRASPRVSAGKLDEALYVFEIRDV